MAEYQLSFMQADEIQAAANVLSIAMLDNPLHGAVFLGKDESVRVEIEKMFFELLTRLPGIVFLVRDGEQIIGVNRMKSCTGSQSTGTPETDGDETDIRWRKSLWHAEWGRRDPSEQHWHLGPIGVLPAYQGKGVGSALMTRFCQEVDAFGAKAYLETDLEKNVLFYQKFGFDIVAVSDIFQVENTYMVRENQ